MGNKPDGYYGPAESIRRDSEKEIFPALTDDQVELREKARTKHQANVDAIKRRGLHDRVVAKLAHWTSLETAGYPLDRGDKAEVVLLKTMLAEVVEEMEACGQPTESYVPGPPLGSKE